MKFLVTGHPCIDEIRTADGGRVRSWGGSFYTLATMQHCARIEDRIFPITPIGAASATDFLGKLAEYSHIDSAGIRTVDAETNRVELRYEPDGSRTERCANALPPVEFEHLRPHVEGAHFILANMVSGSELTLDTLRQVRRASRRPHVFIYLDVHAMTLGPLSPDADTPRKPVSVADWADWMMHVDGVQLNETEVASFGGSEKALADYAAEFRNIQVINVTRGSAGVSVYGRDVKGEAINTVFSRVDVPAVTLGPDADATGCGDVFGGAFIMYFAYTRHAIHAAQFATFVAGANSTLAGSKEIDRLREFVAQYPVFP